MADRQRRIAVGLGALGLRNEQVTRHREHRVEHPCATDVARPELLIDHAPALGVPIACAVLRPGPAGAAGQAGDDEHEADPEVTRHSRHGTSAAVDFSETFMRTAGGSCAAA